MIILGIDYGSARTGVSVCDREELLASPAAVLPGRDAEKLVRDLAALAARYGAGEIVLGLPRNMDGSEGDAARRCRRLALRLAAEARLPVRLWDERLTTVMAHGALSAANVRGKKRKETVDAAAAVIILEDYLRSRKLKRATHG